MKTIIFLLALCLGIPGYSSANTRDYERKIDRAEILFRNGNYTDALTMYLDLYKLDSLNYNVCYKIGVCYMKSGRLNNPSAAQKYLEKAVKGVSKSYEAESRKERKSPLSTYRLLADACHLNYKFDEAILNYQQFKKSGKPDRATVKEIDRKIGMCITGKELMACPAEVKIINMGKSINSPFPDYAPRLTADRSVMIYTSRRPENTGGRTYDGGQYFEDIYIATRNGDEWKSKNIGWPINTVGNEAAIGISAAGQEILIYKDDMGDGNIYSSRLNGSKWSTPKKLNSHINSPYWEPAAFLTADGKTLFFVSDRPGGYGGTDIYRSKRTANGDWGKAVNLGPTVNSPYDEHSPYLHPDGVTLFFSSKGHKTMGGYDVFSTYSLLSDDKAWVEPVNVGYPINTPGDDAFYMVSTDKQFAYYSSQSDDLVGEKDIYMVTFADDKKVPLALIKGRVFDNAGKAARNVTITVTDNGNNEVEGVYQSNSESGQYLFVLTPGKSHNISYEAEGSLFYTENTFIPEADSYRETVKDIKLSDLSAGSKVVLNNIFFDFDQTELKPYSLTELNRVAGFLNTHPKISVEVSGYADSKGSDAYNKRLSLERANAVVNYLMGKGIPKSRLKVMGHGVSDEDAGLKTNLKDSSGRENHRRVELRIIKVK
jgi:outer membrane protein OmpA-like peptidoglycan-associated protein